MQRRAETAAETRQRMVEATAALHAERGVSATSLRDIAERAGVSVGTAYHHFPSYDDAIRACAHYNHQIHPLPDASLFALCTTRKQRIAAFVTAIGAYYERCPWMEQLRAERSRYVPLDEGLQAFEGAVERLALVALRGAVRSSTREAGSRSGAATGNALSTLIALADIAVFRILRERGMPLDGACSTITAAIVASLPALTRRRVGRGTQPSPRRRAS